MLLLVPVNNELSRLPLLRILPKQAACLLPGAEQHNKRRLLVHGTLQLLFCCLFLRSTDSLRLVPFYMIYRQFLFLGNQRLALPALSLDLPHQSGVTLRLRLPYGEGLLNMRFAAANVRELITEDQHTAAQLFQSLRNGRSSTGDQCGQLFDFSFQLPQRRIKSRLNNCKRPGYPMLFINRRLAVSVIVCALSYFLYKDSSKMATFSAKKKGIQGSLLVRQ